MGMLLYNLVVRLYGFVIKVSSLNNPKAKQWITGREEWRGMLKQKISELSFSEKIWIHCASYGEFEQGRPLIEGLKIKYPGHKIILSFFSPSGYEPFKDWKGADIVCYLPLDTKQNAIDFLDIVKPKTAIFIKYEFWLYFLAELKKQKINSYLISAVFKTHHPFFRWYGGIFRKSLKTFTELYLQDEESGRLIEKIGVTNFKVMGDTRFDRVLEIKNNLTELPLIASFKGNSKIIVAGSTWDKDDSLVIGAFELLGDTKVKLILVPHDVDERAINETIAKVQKTKLSYSLFTDAVPNNSQVLIVNTMGLLSKIYHYADCSYIGGGFNGGLHNCLEASVYGKPITFYGKDYVKYNETFDLLKIQAATVVENEKELSNSFRNYLSESFNNEELANRLDAYFQDKSNAVGKILDDIQL